MLRHRSNSHPLRWLTTATFSRLLNHSHEKEALVFVHGFNNRFEDAVYRFAQILHNSRRGRRRADTVHLAVGGQCLCLRV